MKNDFYERNFIMNEYFGKNIRSLRKGKNLTQEQFAEKLGVSFQSVSRWENCVTYPDVEMIPLIARFFNVSTDYIFGIPEEKKKEEFAELLKELDALEANDTERAIQVIRTARANYDAGGEAFGRLCYSLVYSSVRKTKELKNELRKMAEAFFESNPHPSEKAWALLSYVKLEEEQYVPTLLDHYAINDKDGTRDALLYERYLYLDEFDKVEVFRQRVLYKSVDELIYGAISWKDWRAPNDVDFAFWKNNVLLDFLHGFTNEQPKENHPITCGLPLDVFAYQRIELGELRACCLATLSRTEEAYKTLEDTVSLMEHIAASPDGTIIESHSPALPTFKLKIDTTSHGYRRLFYAEDVDMGIREAWVLTPEIDYERLTSDPRWAWFDPIRNDERFKALAERVKKLI